MPTAIHLLASDFPAQPQSFFARPAEVVAPDLVGCRLVKRQDDGSLLWGVIVETRPIPRTIPPVMATAVVRRKTKPCSVSQGGFMCMSAMASTTA